MDKERFEEIKKELELDWSDISYVVNQNDVKWLVNRVEELEQQNKRYREYLELIRITGTHGRIVSTGEIIRSDEANLAEEALEGEK